MSAGAPILVTGGLGFVGSHVVEALLAGGERVRIIDSLHPGAHAVQPFVPDGAEVVIGDVRDPDAVATAADGVRAVCHQAAMVGLGVDLDDLPEYVSHNALGTAVLLRALARARFRGRLVLASSMVVYGEGGYACRMHGRVRPAPRSDAQLRSGASSRPARSAPPRLNPSSWTSAIHRIPAMSTPRRSCTRSTCARCSRARRAPRS